MSADVEAASTLFVEELLMPWLRRINVLDSVNNIALSPVTTAFIVTLVVIYFGFNPAVNALSRAPLRKHLGLKFGKIRVRPHNLSIKLTDLELPCSESSIIRAIILAVIPSAHVKRVKGYPESTVKIKHLSAKVRITSMAAAFHSTVDIESGTNSGRDGKPVPWMYNIIPKLFIKIKLQGLDVWVEKAYLAPTPPEFCTSSPPSALQDLDMSHLPTFEQDSILMNGEISDADRVTFCIERWIDHVTTKLKTSSKSTPDRQQDKSNIGPKPDEPAGCDNATQTNTCTYDEKFNAYARYITLALLQSLSLKVLNAAVVISGAGSDSVRATCKKYSPRRSNFEFATQKKRALTIGRADLLSLSFSPDSKCVGVLCCVGLSLKVGHPAETEDGSRPEDAFALLEPSNDDLPYEWHTIAHPFELVVELSGLVSIIIWAINYDHYWDTRSIGLTLSSSEVAVSLSPSHIHTALLHLDDYTDVNSPCNEWIRWLNTNFRRTLKTGEQEKLAYCEGYAQAKGKKCNDTSKKAERTLTAIQMKEVERRMSRNEITSLRCIAMANHWRIPKLAVRTSDELANFIENTRSEIVKSEDIKMIDLDEPNYTFQRTFPSALRALVSLIREKNSFLTPSLKVISHFRKLLIDFPSYPVEIRKSIEHPIPSCIDLNEVAFSTELENPIFTREASSPMAPRRWLTVGLHVSDIEWGVLISDPQLPVLLDDSPVGMVYKYRQTTDSTNVLSLDINASLEPTKQMDPHYSLSFDSSFMSIVVNPLPLLSAIQTLMLLSDIPMHTLEAPEANEQIPYTEEEKDDVAYQVRGEVTNLAMPNVTVEFSIECCSVIFLVDRLKLRRGIFDFNISRLTVSLNVTNTSARLVMAADPLEICAGQPQYSDAKVVWSLLPLKPIIVIEGTRIVLFATEKDPKQKSNSSIQSSITNATSVSLEIGVAFVCLNASPSTIVALLEAAKSVKPFAAWLTVDSVEKEKQISLERKKSTEEHQLRFEQRRKALLEVFESIDVDGSGSLQDTELAEVVRLMFEKTTSGAINPQQKLTAFELETQHNYLLSILDPSSTNDISYQELDDLLFRIANSIDDINLIPKMIPIDELYEKETGCVSDDLNGHDIAMVQQKLVRALCNYEFAKFCWRSLVQPQLQGKSGDGIDRSVSSWVIDTNTKSRNISAIDKILETISFNAQETTPQKEDINTIFDLCLVASFNKVSLGFGSPHIFTQPLVDINLSNIVSSANCLLSQAGWFVPVAEESEKCNKIIFQSMISAMHLNTRHDYMECLIEPYPCYAHATYKVLLEETGTNNQNEPERTSFSIHINCPRSMNINTSPSFFESATLLNRVISESDPKTYRKWLVKRDLDFVKSFWSEFTTAESDALNQHDAKEALLLTFDLHWRDEISGFSDDVKDNLISTIVKLAETDESGMIPFNKMELVLKKVLSRCYFSGSKELQVVNNCGRELKVSLSSRSETFKSIEDGRSGSIVLDESGEGQKSADRQKVNGIVSFSISGYRIVTNVAISPYQSFMIALKLPKDSKRRRARRNKPRNASGFAPYLTVVPQEGSLTSISLIVRTSVAIETEHPINIRIVRLPKSFGRSRQGSNTKLDLSKKKYLSAALQALVEGAQIVFEMRHVETDITVPIHLGVLDSSCHHALLIQDLSERNDSWRHPVLLTNDFLFNPRKLIEVTRCHTMSGIIVHRERLRIHSEQSGSIDIEHDSQSNSWDTIIKVVPFFLLQNSMPYMISIRLWQLGQGEDDDLWQHPSLYLSLTSGSFDEESGSDDDSSAMTPASQTRSQYSNQFHQSSGREKRDFFFVGSVESCQMLRLSGISLSQPIFMQVSQSVESHVMAENMNFMWSRPLSLSLDKLRTGANRKGSLSLPKLVLDLGDEVDALVDVSVDGKIGMPACTIFCPFWIMNKTGMKMEYKVSGQSKKYLDSGTGGLPVMIHGAKSIKTNATYKKVSRQISAVPLECPKECLLQHWWDETMNGKLVLMKIPTNNNVGWSENIELDAVGTSGELLCRNVVLNTSIESLAGTFHRSSLVTLGPRYVVKNMLHISITVIPLCGGQSDVIKKALHLRDNPTSFNKREQLTLNPNESTVLYKFHDISFGGVEGSRRWVVFCVNATRSKGTLLLQSKWHIVPTDRIDQFYFGEHDGLDTMCAILQAKVHRSSFGSILMGISHSAIPPYRIENRSAYHYLHIVQDDDDGIVFELPPMHSCGYTWDSPLGKKELMAVVVPRTESKSSISTQGRLADKNNKGTLLQEGDETVSIAKSKVTEQTMDSNYETNHEKGSRNVEQLRTSKFRRFFTGGYKRYSMSKPGRQQDLPAKSSKERRFGSLCVHLRIMGGTKILSFSDSDWLAKQVERGNLRKGGEFKHAESEMNFEGIGLYVIDDLNRELLGITVRDVQIQKPRGTIDLTMRVRHFQVDAMLPSARYPIIIQPLPLGVDRREPPDQGCDRVLDSNIVKKDCYWEKHNERPIPVLELTGSYVPQTNMTWIPSLDVMICPCKVEIDVDYILRVVGVIMNSISKFKDVSKNIVATSSASERLQYISRGQQNTYLTYIENFYISPVYVEIELDIKPDDSDDNNDYESLTLNNIAQSTNSALVAGILSWIINVGANFAHVSPCFRYNEITATDRYCDVVDLATDVAVSYVVKTIKQCYKVVFSMHLLGDPSLYAYQVKTGVTDLFTKTRHEILSGGQDGVGQGVASFFSNVVGGFFIWGGKLTGGIAETLDSIATSEYTSNHLKAKSDGKPARNAIDGVLQGAEYLSRTVVHGVAGLVGNPYRGMKSGGAAGFTKGAASGVTGLFFAPFIGALGFVAKTSEGIGENSKILNIAVIEARCRPARSVPWGKPMVQIGLSFLKGIGIRVHTVRYQKIRKQIIQQSNQDIEISSKELKRARAAEERRKNPPYKAVSIIHNKQRQHYLTYKVKPKLLPDRPGNWVLSHYAVIFEETLVLRTPDLQLTDQGDDCTFSSCMKFSLLSWLSHLTCTRKCHFP
eukprot:CCRYP_010547-RA/>CCRYP_010547-RA protein AED:0.05 eAED:0.05 QI:183/0.85/0.81/1/0.76/0.63/22/985/2990